MSILDSIIGTESNRLIKKWAPQVEQINGLESKIKSLSDADFKTKTEELLKYQTIKLNISQK